MNYTTEYQSFTHPGSLESWSNSVDEITNAWLNGTLRSKWISNGQAESDLLSYTHSQIPAAEIVGPRVAITGVTPETTEVEYSKYINGEIAQEKRTIVRADLPLWRSQTGQGLQMVGEAIQKQLNPKALKRTRISEFGSVVWGAPVREAPNGRTSDLDYLLWLSQEGFTTLAQQLMCLETPSHLVSDLIEGYEHLTMKNSKSPVKPNGIDLFLVEPNGQGMLNRVARFSIYPNRPSQHLLKHSQS